MPWRKALWDGDTLTAPLDFAAYKAIAMACDNGATFPSTPAIGQWFLHTPTGRNILYQYDGTNWIPIISLGAMTLYVDNTDGTDDLAYGTGVDANAFKTVQYAIDCIPGLVGGDVTININDETYSEDVVIQGKFPTGNYVIELQGALSQQDTGTCTTGSVQGSGATQGTVEDDAGGWTADAYANMLLVFDAGAVNAGVYRLIDSNDANTATIGGTWPNGAPASGDTFKIYDWATTIQSLELKPHQIAVKAYDIAFSNQGTMNPGASIAFERCKLTEGCQLSVPGAEMELEICYIPTSSPNKLGCTGQSKVTLSRSKLICSDTTAYAGLSGAHGAHIKVWHGTIVDGTSANTQNVIRGARNSVFDFYAPAADGYNQIRNGNVGLRAITGAMMANTQSNNYTGNTTNESAESTSYGYID